jgi:hypothetical protein
MARANSSENAGDPAPSMARLSDNSVWVNIGRLPRWSNLAPGSWCGAAPSAYWSQFNEPGNGCQDFLAKIRHFILKNGQNSELSDYLSSLDYRYIVIFDCFEDQFCFVKSWSGNLEQPVLKSM